MECSKALWALNAVCSAVRILKGKYSGYDRIPGKICVSPH